MIFTFNNLIEGFENVEYPCTGIVYGIKLHLLAVWEFQSSEECGVISCHYSQVHSDLEQ